MRRVDSLEKTLMLGGIGAGGKGDNRGWDGWMASLTCWTCVWVNSGSWWWTVRPGALQFTGLQRVGHDWATELNWTELKEITRASLVAQMVKHLPTMQETWVRSLGQEDPLEKEMATHSSTLAWTFHGWLTWSLKEKGLAKIHQTNIN